MKKRQSHLQLTLNPNHKSALDFDVEKIMDAISPVELLSKMDLESCGVATNEESSDTSSNTSRASGNAFSSCHIDTPTSEFAQLLYSPASQPKSAPRRPECRPSRHAVPLASEGASSCLSSRSSCAPKATSGDLCRIVTPTCELGELSYAPSFETTSTKNGVFESEHTTRGASSLCSKSPLSQRARSSSSTSKRHRSAHCIESGTSQHVHVNHGVSATEIGDKLHLETKRRKSSFSNRALSSNAMSRTCSHRTGSFEKAASMSTSDRSSVIVSPTSSCAAAVRASASSIDLSCAQLTDETSAKRGKHRPKAFTFSPAHRVWSDSNKFVISTDVQSMSSIRGDDNRAVCKPNALCGNNIHKDTSLSISSSITSKIRSIGCSPGGRESQSMVKVNKRELFDLTTNSSVTHSGANGLVSSSPRRKSLDSSIIGRLDSNIPASNYLGFSLGGDSSRLTPVSSKSGNSKVSHRFRGQRMLSQMEHENDLISHKRVSQSAPFTIPRINVCLSDDSPKKQCLSQLACTKQTISESDRSEHLYHADSPFSSHRIKTCGNVSESDDSASILSTESGGSSPDCQLLICP